MKQTLLFFAFLTFGWTALIAQVSYEATPNPYVNTFTDVDLTDNWAEPVAHVTVENTSSSNVELLWTLEVIDAPAEWEYRVCDDNQCYSSVVTTNGPPDVDIPVLLEPDSSSILDLHVLPRTVAGECTAYIYLSTFADPTTIIDTVVYQVEILGANSVSEVEKSTLRVFPNPATDYVEVANADVVDELVFYNVVGRQVRSFDVNPGSRYHIADLPDGLYLVSFVNHQEGILRTVRLSKRSLRP